MGVTHWDVILSMFYPGTYYIFYYIHTLALGQCFSLLHMDSPTIWCLCAFFPILVIFYVPFYMKKGRWIILMGLWNLNSLKDQRRMVRPPLLHRHELNICLLSIIPRFENFTRCLQSLIKQTWFHLGLQKDHRREISQSVGRVAGNQNL